MIRPGLALCLALWLPGLQAGAEVNAPALYRAHCARCHGQERLGGMGPALLPENLHRLKPRQAREVILHGRPATQMPAFADRLDARQVDALVQYLYTPPPRPPRWGRREIERSRRLLVPASRLPDHPLHHADPLNLFVVVELGDHHITILDGDRFVPLARFPTHYAVHGGPKFSPDGRFVYVSSRDGWVEKYDLWSLQKVAEVRAGLNTRNLAVSDDGRYVLVGNYLPHTLVLLDAGDLHPLRILEVRGRDGTTSRVSAVYTAPPRHSFIVALKDIPEVWEIDYADEPLPVYNGPMHDYRMQEGLARVDGRFPVRRIQLAQPLDDFFFDPGYHLLIGAARRAGKVHVIQLDVGQKIADLPIDGMPHLGSGITWLWHGRRVLATPNLRKPEITVIDMKTWKVVKRIPTQGPGFFLRSHENSPYAWADVFFGPHRDLVHIIDKRKLEIVKTLRPVPGKTSAHVEFDRDGTHALLSIWDRDGAVIVYDARTLKEVKRLPMVKPSGKYNVYNKITRSEGTSH